METRLEKTKKMMESSGLRHLMIVSTPDVRYLSNYNPIIGSASVLLSINKEEEEGEPTLLIDQEWDLLRAKDSSFLSRVEAVSDISLGATKVMKRLRFRGEIGVVGWSMLSTPLYLRIKKALPEIQIRDVTEKMREIRMVKSPLEIEWLTKAIKITDEGGKKATEAIEDGKRESDVAIAAEFAMKSEGASELSFPTVVGSGTRTEMIVPLPTEKKISNGELVLMDLGGRYNGYCGDLSRTKLCGRGNPNAKQKELFEVVMEMHRKAVDSSRPGIKAVDIHRISNKVAEEAGYGKYIKHMTGHGIGLEDHEKPILETDETKLVPGIVHSIEPGLYVPGVGGIRIEDLVLVTESGRKVISSFDRALA
jgi:Xaa-Pro dipeptidase